MSTKGNFFTVATVTSTSFSDCRRDFGMGGVSAGIMLLVDSSNVSDEIEYSFNSTTVHGNLKPGSPNEGIAFDNRHESTVWLRLKNAGRTVNVRVEAWQ